MSLTSLPIHPFNTKSALPDEYADLNRHTNRLRLERLPDDPPIPLAETVQNLMSIPPFVDLNLWIIRDPASEEILGQANVLTFRTEENRHLAQFDITILPEYRRQGLGRRFLALVAAAAQNDGRRLLMTSTNDSQPGGETFMRRIGAQKGLQGHTNQLKLADLDRNLVTAWLERGQVNLADFALGFWNGAYPEAVLSEVAELYELTNQQPIGDLEIEDMHMTPEQLRQMETNLFARGSQRWTFYVTERSSGKFVGYTETIWNPNRPELLSQGMTGVFPQHRKRGLGRWLKAAMLEKILLDRPQIKYIRTGNADANTAMLKINTELGFQPYMAEALWQVELDVVLAYLQGHTV